MTGHPIAIAHRSHHPMRRPAPPSMGQGQRVQPHAPRDKSGRPLSRLSAIRLPPLGWSLQDVSTTPWLVSRPTDDATLWPVMMIAASRLVHPPSLSASSSSSSHALWRRRLLASARVSNRAVGDTYTRPARITRAVRPPPRCSRRPPTDRAPPSPAPEREVPPLAAPAPLAAAAAVGRSAVSASLVQAPLRARPSCPRPEAASNGRRAPGRVASRGGRRRRRRAWRRRRKVC